MVCLYLQQKRLLHRRNPVLHDRMILAQNEEDGMTEQMRKPRRILVGLKTLDNAVELTTLACRLSSRGASLVLVHVIELPDNTALDAAVPGLEAAAQGILRAGERVARRSHLKAKTRVLRAHSASCALLDELKEQKSDLASGPRLSSRTYPRRGSIWHDG